MIAMSVREFASEDAESRKERADDVTIQDVRIIDGEAFDFPEDATVFEVDLLNEDGAPRDNMVIIPRVLFENTKDVQYRHEKGIIGKYSLALAQENEQARQELYAGIEESRSEIQQEMADLQERDGRLLHFQAELDFLD
jgi:cell division protein FtsB